MALDAGLLNFRQGVAPDDGSVAFGAFHLIGHHIMQRFFLPQGFSPNEFELAFMTIDTFRLRSMMTT